jgi:hypothetical protein
MFYIWVCIRSCLFLCICLSFESIFHAWEKTCVLCLSEPGLLHLTWCFPIISICLQITCHYSLWLSKTPLFICHIFLIHLSVVGHLACFQSLVIVNSAAMNISIQVSLLYPVLCSFGYMSKSSITGSVSLYHMTGLSLAFWGISKLPSISGCTNLHSHQQCIRISAYVFEFNYICKIPTWSSTVSPMFPECFIVLVSMWILHWTRTPTEWLRKKDCGLKFWLHSSPADNDLELTFSIIKQN